MIQDAFDRFMAKVVESSGLAPNAELRKACLAFFMLGAHESMTRLLSTNTEAEVDALVKSMQAEIAASAFFSAAAESLELTPEDLAQMPTEETKH